MKLERRSVEDLSVHPALKRLPAIDPDSPEFAGIEESVRERGMDYPITIDETNRVLDGRHRLAAAKRCGMTEVEVIVRDSTEVAEVIMETLLQRRHFTTGARAYLVVPLIKAYLDARKTRRLKNLKKGQCFPNPLEAESGNGLPLSGRLGISDDEIERAQKLHKIYDADPDYKADTEHKLLSGEAGLGALIAGHAGRMAPQPIGADKSAEAFGKAASLLIKRFPHWLAVDDRARADLRQEIIVQAAALGKDDLSSLADWMESTAKQLRKTLRKEAE